MDDFKNDLLFICSRIRSLLDLEWVVRIRIINIEHYCSHKNILRKVSVWGQSQALRFGLALSASLSLSRTEWSRIVCICPLFTDFSCFDGISAYFVWTVTAEHSWMMDNWKAHYSPDPPAPSAVGLPLETVELHAYLEGQRERKKESECLRLFTQTCHQLHTQWCYKPMEPKSPALIHSSRILFWLEYILTFVWSLCESVAWKRAALAFCKIASFVFYRRKPYNMSNMSKWWQSFHFGLTIPIQSCQ